MGGTVTDITGSEAPPVRYWKPVFGELAGDQVLPPLESTSPVPVRTDPRLLVLLYHNIVYGRTGNTYNRDLYNFEHDLAYIRRNFSITNFDAVLRDTGTRSHDRAIITFDDGDLSIYAIVYPLFRRHEIEATFFIVPSFIGTVGYMSWDQVREMSSYRTADGRRLFHFGSHSLTHRPLGELSLPDVRRELSESKRIIEEQTGQKVQVLALPFGSGAGDENIIRIAREAGYTAVRTSRSKAALLEDIDPWAIGAMNVENYSSDVMVTRALDLMGYR
ncbi:MAG: polysaccharide deacetylase family protein [Sphaerochaetaceae bacterium]|nr:polysaccharide deacetylase family protein [Sphaerochaetaceae bacterium]